MTPRQINGCEEYGDIVSLHGIIKISMYWQEIILRESVKLGVKFRGYLQFGGALYYLKFITT